MPVLSGVLRKALPQPGTPKEIQPRRHDPTTSHVAPATSENPQRAAPSGPSPSESRSHGAHHETKPHVKGQNLMINAAVAIVSYAKSSQVNLFRGHMRNSIRSSPFSTTFLQRMDYGGRFIGQDSMANNDPEIDPEMPLSCILPHPSSMQSSEAAIDKRA